MRMFVSQTPVRLSMGGGGTDLAAYYEKHGGFWTAATINQYVYLTVNIRFDDNYVIKYSNIAERVDDIEKIENPYIRAILKFMRFDQWNHRLFRSRGLEINIISDVPTKSGLGVSGAMTVGLLTILHQLKGDISVNLKNLAEEAYYIEHDLVGSNSTGKQDQYIASFGGITSFEVDRSGQVNHYPLELDRHTIAELEDNIVLFGTKLERLETADQALRRVVTKLKSNLKPNNNNQLADLNSKPTNYELYLTTIKQIGLKQRDALLKCQLRRFGKLLDEHWQVKKKYSGAPDSAVDKAYKLAKKTGALGGKVIGASTKGAFMMFYTESGKEKLRPIMASLGMVEIPWAFEFSGSRIIHIH